MGWLAMKPKIGNHAVSLVLSDKANIIIKEAFNSCIKVVGFLGIQHLSEKIGAFIVFNLFCLILPNLCRCVWKMRIFFGESICSLIC